MKLILILIALALPACGSLPKYLKKCAVAGSIHEEAVFENCEKL